MRDRAPFNAGFIKDREKLNDLKAHYHAVVVPEINTDFAEMKLRKRRFSFLSADERVEDLKELARYFRNRILTAFREDKRRLFEAREEDTADAFVWECAITDLDPTSPTLGVVATAAGAFLPGGGIIRLAGTGSVSIECGIRDGDTGELLAGLRDRESEKTAPFTLKDFQMYGHAREAMDDWAGQFVELASTPLSTMVKDSSPFTLWPF